MSGYPMIMLSGNMIAMVVHWYHEPPPTRLSKM